MHAIENVRSDPSREPGDAELAMSTAPAGAAEHWLDSAENRRLHAKLLDYWYTALDAQFENRAEQMLDYDFYDHIQWSDRDRQTLAARHQAPLTYNKIKMALDWIIGTERRTRIDGVVHPREEGDVDVANIKSELLKYLSDANRIPWARSAAFKDAAIVGLGWTEETVRTSGNAEPVASLYVPWWQMRRDPYSRALDLSDARFLLRDKFTDLDYTEAMFPDRMDLLQRAARDHFHGDEGGYDEEIDLPQVFRNYDSRGHEVTGRRLHGRTSLDTRCRMRVRLIECWFRKPVAHKRIWGGAYNGDRFNPQDPEHAAAHAELLAGKPETIYSLTNAVAEEMWCAIFTEEGLLDLKRSPYKHGQFPYTPYWCFRRNRDGMEYGVVRGIRDAQEDLNKRMSKLLWALSTNQLLYEEGAIDPDRLEEIKQELAKPNGVLEFAAGALSGNRVKIERNYELADAQIKLLEIDAAHIHDGSGVNRELLGRETNAQSGRAILAKQQEGSVTTAELFDNYRLGHQLSGEKLLSNTEQFITEERQFRIVGERKGLDWKTINQLRLDTLENVWVVDNDITRNQADFIVDQQDFRESMRQAAAEQFFEMLGKLPPDIALQLLDLAIDMTDMPIKEEVVARIRKLNGQTDSGQEESPEQAEKRIAQEEAAAAEQQLSMRERMAKVGLDEAKQQDLMAKVQKTVLENKGKALDVAQLLEILFPLAPAADRLLSTQQPPGEVANAA